MSRSALVLVASVLIAACGSASTTTTTVTVLDGSAPSPAPATVTVTAPAASSTGGTVTSPAPAGSSDTVTVVDAGYSQKDKELGIGVLLRNNSAQDAKSVRVSVNIVDADDDVLKTETGSLNLIPAGETVAVGIDTFLDAPAKPKTLEVIVTTDSYGGSGTELPALRRVQVKSDELLGSTVTGEIRNTTSHTVSSIQQISVALIGSDGRVIGGGYTFPGIDIPPGSRAAFSASNGVSVTPRARIRKAIVTIDGGF
jgi:hypothetical protein